MRSLFTVVSVALAGMLAVSGYAGRQYHQQQRTRLSTTTSGPLLASSGGGVVLAADGMAPGDRSEGAVTIANAGGLAGRLTLTASTRDRAGLARSLRLHVTELAGEESSEPRELYDGPLASFERLDLGTLPSDGLRVYRFEAVLPAEVSDNSLQGSRASTTFTWRLAGF
jgi:hypothetical protein